MKPEVMLELLESAAQQLAIKVSYEPLQTAGIQSGLRGGLCRVKGSGGVDRMQWRVIIDKRATDEERVAVLASAIARFDTIALEMPQKLRDLLRLYARTPLRAA